MRDAFGIAVYQDTSICVAHFFLKLNDNTQLKKINTVLPIGELIMNKLVFSLIQKQDVLRRNIG